MKKWIFTKTKNLIFLVLIWTVVSLIIFMMVKFDIVDHTIYPEYSDKNYNGNYDPTLEIGQQYGGR
jgi:hypothetical protein